MSITLDFGGGLEYLFNNEKQHTIIVKHLTTALHPHPPTLNDLIHYLAAHKCDQQRIDMFVVVSNEDVGKKVDEMTEVVVRPGILVLVNDCDWEIVGGGEYVIQDHDRVTMISTLHGG